MRRFFNGILVGSLIGGMLGLMLNGNMKPQQKKLLGRTKKFSDRATKVVGDVSKEVTKFMKRKKAANAAFFSLKKV
ncbi:MAG: hypothetical protein PWP71_1072 [Clostridia bacterium]|nr:hypothetical protein [Clostridia bacterium]